MQNFEFHNPTKLIFGKNTIPHIGKEIKNHGIKKVLLVAGAGSIKKNGVYEQVINSLQKEKIKWIESWGVKPNPILSKVREMINIAKKEKVDAVLAVGGGSVIDSAKAVAAGYYMKDIWAGYEGTEFFKKALPVYIVLTISAAGSEMDPFSVLTNEIDQKKWALKDPLLYPKISIVDPSVQITLPWDQTVNGAIDIMSHIMEQYFINGKSETCLSLNEALFKTIIKMTDSLKKDPKDYECRANVAWAAILAINGISGAGQGGGDWTSHAIEHAISAIKPDIAHGSGLGVVFPAWIAYCQSANPEIFKRWARNIWDADTVEQGILAMKKKIKSWGAPTTLKELGISDVQIKIAAKKVMEYGISGAVKKLNENDIIKILELAK